MACHSFGDHERESFSPPADRQKIRSVKHLKRLLQKAEAEGWLMPTKPFRIDRPVGLSHRLVLMRGLGLRVD